MAESVRGVQDRLAAVQRYRLTIGSGAPRAGPLAQPITRLELPGAPASPLACAPEAQPPPR